MAPVFTNIKDKQLITYLCHGKLGVLPTDTLYGLVCKASDLSAVTRLYKLKKCDKKPGTIIAASIDQLVDLGFKRRYLNAVKDYWPGSVSVIIPTDNSNLSYLDLGKGTLAVRVVAENDLENLLQKTGPLLTSSANLPTHVPARNVMEAQAYFGDEVDFYADGGDYSKRQPSTIIRIIDDNVKVLRDGVVKIDNKTGRIII